jgi:PAS domain S-box-containing protein
MSTLANNIVASRDFLTHPKRLLRPLLVSSVYLLLIMGLDWLGAGPWRLSFGLAIGLLLAYGYRYLPLAIAGEALVGSWTISGPVALPEAVLCALMVGSSYVLALFIIRLACGNKELDLLNCRQLCVLMMLIPCAGFLGALAQASGHWLFGRVASDGFWGAVIAGSASNSAGIVLVAPAMLLIFARMLELALASLAGEQRPPSVGTATWQWETAASIVSGAICTVFIFSITDRFSLFCMIAIPMAAIALKYGNYGAATLLFALGCLGAIASSYGLVLADSVGSQLVVAVTGANALFLGSSISYGMRQEKTARRQAGILNSVKFATDELLTMTDRDQTVHAVLQHLAADTEVARVYILENRTDLSTSAQPIYKHWRVARPEDERQSELLDAALCRRINQNAAMLSEGKVLQFSTSDLPEDEQKVLSSLNIHRSVILPIFVHDRWWGCLGLDQGVINWRWQETEVNAFQAAGRVLAALLSHANVEQQFRQLTGNIPAVFWIATPDGLEKTYVSPAYEQIWGWPYESIMANPSSWIAPVYHEDYARISAAIPKQMLGEYDEEYRIVRSDRSVRWIRETAFPVLDTSGQVTRIVGIAQDITRQKEAEERLGATSVLLSSLIDNLHAGIVVEDQSRRVIHVNQAFCRMFDVDAPSASLVGRDSKLAFPSQQEWSKRIDEIIREKKECRNEEMVSGSGRVFCRDYFPLSVDDDRHYHLWRYEDITDRKRSDERIRASLKEKEVLLKEIHHRVKNNLQVISSLMNLQANQLRDKETAEAFRDSQSRVKAMSLVHERLYQSSDLAQIDFAGYVRDVTNHLLRSYQTGRHAVRLKVEVEPVSLNIDTAIPCALIINELVSNSLKYAFPNGRDGEIRIRMNHTDSDDLNLVISDNGVGFPEDIFWEQRDSLGLQLVRNLTDQLNGSIQCHLKKGAQFDIRFRPLANECRN